MNRENKSENDEDGNNKDKCSNKISEKKQKLNDSNIAEDSQSVTENSNGSKCRRL